MQINTIIHNTIVGTIVAIALSLSPTLAGAADGPELGETQPEDAAGFWTWALEIPADHNPILDHNGEDCDEAQPDDLWYLAGTDGGPATRHCTVPANTALVFPLLTAVYIPDPGEIINHKQMLDALDGVISQTCSLHLLVNGEPVVDDPYTLRLHTMKKFSVEVPDDGAFGIPEGTYGAAADGFFARLEGLDSGEHLVEFGGAICDPEGKVVFTTEVKYFLDVGDGV